MRFAVWQFLDMQTDQLTELDQNITSLSLADERCSLMKEELEVFTETLLEDQTWSREPVFTPHSLINSRLSPSLPLPLPFSLLSLSPPPSLSLSLSPFLPLSLPPSLSPSDWPRESTEMVKKYLEDQLFSIVYPHVFQPNMEVDKDKDK